MKPQCIAVLAAVLALGWLPAMAQENRLSTLPDFEVEGIGFTSCQCPAYGCPCRSNGHPTHGSCQAADFAYIQKGYFGQVRLDGVRFVTVGDLIDSSPDATYGTLYIDPSATLEQRQAIQQLLTALVGSWAAVRVHVQVAPVRFYESADRTVYLVEVPGILTQLSVLKRDPSGEPVSTVPAIDPWGNTIHYADNIVFRYNDGTGHAWDLSGRQSNLKFFHTTRQMYANGELLVQYADMTGTWNAKQKELLKKLGLKPE